MTGTLVTLQQSDLQERCSEEACREVYLKSCKVLDDVTSDGRLFRVFAEDAGRAQVTNHTVREDQMQFYADIEQKCEKFCVKLQLAVQKMASNFRVSFFAAPCGLKPCPHCRRKVRLLHKSETVADNGETTATTARQRRQSHFSATVSLFCDSVDTL